MNQHDAWLEAIIASPDDDAPRLLYADYLDKHHQPERAEFIRVQCTLDKYSPDDRRRTELREREQQLLGQYGWDWAEDFGLEIDEWVYHRGFIERVQTCLETSADKIVAVLRKSPIRHIRDDYQFCDFSGVLGALPHFERLTGLEFWGLYAGEDEAVARLLSSPHLRNLRTLVLHHDRNGNLVDEKVIAQALHSPHRCKLEELAVNVDCMWRGPSNLILQAIADSPYLRNLRKLNLSNAGDTGNNPQLTLESVRRLAASPNLAHLEELDLRNTHATAEVWRGILDMPQLPRLRKLYLGSATEVTTPWIPIIGELRALAQWRTAFDERVRDIDWETRFIDPWNCWRGVSWADRRRQFLFDMNKFVVARDYDGLEQAYSQVCRRLAGDGVADEIQALDFDRYGQTLNTGLRAAITAFRGGPAPPPEFLKSMGNSFPAEAQHIVKKLREAIAAKPRGPARAIYLRLRTDLDWRGHFHLTDEMPTETLPCSEGGYKLPIAELLVGTYAEAGAILKRYPRGGSTRPSGPYLYLIARSVAALGRVAAQHELPVPLYFSCLDAVFKM